MTKIEILKDKNFTQKYSLKMSDHADSSERGTDIVCAALSTLAFTLIESMDKVVKLDKRYYSYKIDERNTIITLDIFLKMMSKEKNKEIKLLTSMFETGVRKIAEDNFRYAKVHIKEV